MDSLIIIILGLAFYWLMIETNWLRVRLPFGWTIKEYEALDAVINITPTLVLVGFITAAVVSGFFGLKDTGGWFIKSIGYSVAEHEADMSRLWKAYGRKQPKQVKG